MNKKSVFTAMAALAIAVVATAAGEKKADTKKPAEKKVQTHCPVMQRYEISKDKYVDVKGYRIYTCCSGCISQIKANPDKYIKRLQDQGVELEKAPAPDKKK